MPRRLRTPLGGSLLLTEISAGKIDIGTLTTTDSTSQSIAVKKSGISLSGTSLFVGVSKITNTSDNTSVTNSGSLVGSSAGNVTLNAAGAVNVTGSKVASPGVTTIIGESIAITNATNIDTGKQTSKSSSIGVTATLNSPILSGIQAIASTAKIAANGNSDRTSAVAGVAAGLAAVNTVDAVKSALKNPGDLGSVTVTAGFSKSSSVTDTVQQSVVGSTITGGDVSLIARGSATDPKSGTITVTGSNIAAGRDLTLLAPEIGRAS